MTDRPPGTPPPGEGAPSVLQQVLHRLTTLLRGRGAAGSLARGSIWVLVVSGSSMVVGFVLQVLLTNTLGPQEYGLYVYVIGWLNVAVLFAKIDLDTAAIRFIGTYSGAGQWGHVRGYLQGIARPVAWGALLISMVGSITLWQLRSVISPNQFWPFLVACNILPIATVLRMLAGTAQGLGRVAQAQLPESVIRPSLTAILVIVAIYGMGSARTAAVALGANFVASAVALAVGLWMLLRALPPEYHTAEPHRDRKSWIRTGTGLFTISLFQLILSTGTDVVVVGTFLSFDEAGRYSVASLVASFCTLGSGAVLFTATPMIADFHANRSPADFQRLLTSIARANVVVTVPLIVAVAVLGPFLLRIFDPTFVAAYPILLVCLANTLQNSIVGTLAGFVLTMTGRQIPAARIIATGSAAYLLAVYPLTSTYGAVGTATATMLAFMVRSALLVWYIRTRLRVNVLPV